MNYDITTLMIFSVALLNVTVNLDGWYDLDDMYGAQSVG